MIKNFINDEEGLELVEYGITAGLIAIAVIILFTGIGTSLRGIFGELNEEMTAANAAAAS